MGPSRIEPIRMEPSPVGSTLIVPVPDHVTSTWRGPAGAALSLVELSLVELSLVELSLVELSPVGPGPMLVDLLAQA